MVEAEDVPVLPHIFPGLTECGLIGSFVAQIVKRGNRHRHAVRLKVLLVVYQMAAVVMHDHGQSRCGVGGHACGAIDVNPIGPHQVAMVAAVEIVQPSGIIL